MSNPSKPKLYPEDGCLPKISSLLQRKSASNLSQTGKDWLDLSGDELIEEAEIGDYQFFVVYTPMIELYQLALQRKGHDAFDLNQQVTRHPGGTGNGSFREMIHLINGWIDKYGELGIASTGDPSKRDAYVKMARALGFTVNINMDLGIPIPLISGKSKRASLVACKEAAANLPMRLAVNYEEMFKALLKGPYDKGRETDALQRIQTTSKNEITWAKKVLKKNDKIIWWLRWVRLHLEEMFAYDTLFLKDWAAYQRSAAGIPLDNQDIPSSLEFRSLRTAIEHFMSLPVDGIEGYQPGYKAIKTVIDDLTRLETEWKESRKSILKPREEDTILIDLGGGWAWFLLPRNICDDEARAMGHCGNGSSEDETERILSLRQSKGNGEWEPHCTFIIREDGMLTEMKGKANAKPVAKYFPAIVALLKNDIVKGIVGGGYLPKNNFNIADLPEETQEEIYELKPELMPLRVYYAKFGADDHFIKSILEYLHNGSSDWDGSSDWVWDVNWNQFVEEKYANIQDVIEHEGGRAGVWILRLLDGDNEPDYHSAASAKDMLDDLDNSEIEKIGLTLQAKHADEIQGWLEEQENYDLEDKFDPTDINDIISLAEMTGDELIYDLENAAATGYRTSFEKKLESKLTGYADSLGLKEGRDGKWCQVLDPLDALTLMEEGEAPELLEGDDLRKYSIDNSGYDRNAAIREFRETYQIDDKFTDALGEGAITAFDEKKRTDKLYKDELSRISADLRAYLKEHPDMREHAMEMQHDFRNGEREPFVEWARTIVPDAFYFDQEANSKTAYVTTATGELTVTIDQTIRPKITMSLNLGLQAMPRFAITVPVKDLENDEIEEYTRKAYKTLLEGIAADLNSMEFESLAVGGVLAAAQTAFNNLSEEHATDHKGWSDGPIRTYEIHFPLTPEFMAESMDKSVLASTVRRSPDVKELILPELRADDSPDSAEEAVSRAREQVGRNTPHPLLRKDFKEKGKAKDWEDRVKVASRDSYNRTASSNPIINTAAAAAPAKRAPKKTTPNLKSWFGASQVVDDKGNPLPVYHGSRSSWITSFDVSMEGTGVVNTSGGKLGGIWFTSSKDNAAFFSNPIDDKPKAQEKDFEVYGDKGTFYGAVAPEDGGEGYLFTVGPYGTEEEVEQECKREADRYNKHLTSDTSVLTVYLKILKPYRLDGVVPRKAEFEAAKESGCDGIIATDVVDGPYPSTVYVVFSGSQVKSVDAGLFDPQNPSITAAAAAAPAKRAPKKTTPNFINTPAFKAWFGASKVVDSKGKPMPVYHGTTHDFSEFSSESGNESAYYGKALYFTSSTKDASENYASVGPDLTYRIESEADQIEERMVYEKIKNEEWDTWPNYNDPKLMALTELAKREATNKLKGSHDGAILPCYLKMLNPVVISPNGGTYLQISSPMYDAINNALAEVNGGEYLHKIWENLSDYDEMSAFEFEQKLRSLNELGDLDEKDASSVISSIYKELGYDGIIMDANVRFPGMKMDAGTKHYICWNPNQVKSAIGNNGNFDPQNPSITAGLSKEATSWLLSPKTAKPNDSRALQVPITETPAFKAWFAGSKVVDEAGNPLRVYHGTKSPGFDEFDFNGTPEGRVYFSESPEHASEYAMGGFHPDRETAGAGVYPCYLSIRNPLDLIAFMAGDHDDIGYSAKSWIKHGYDGAFGMEDGHKVWIAFHPNQIKSATGNSGAFDPGSKSITAADYEGMFSSLLKYIEKQDALPQKEDSLGPRLAVVKHNITAQINWAKRVFKNNNAWMLWWLRWYRCTLDSQYAPDLLAKDLAALQAKDPSITPDDVMTHSQIGHHGDKIQHFMGTPCPAITNYRPEFKPIKTVEFDLQKIEREWKESRKGIIVPQEDDTILIQFQDGWAWWLLPRESCDAEAEAMGHCGNSGDPRAGDRILSLRRLKGKDWFASLTFILRQDGFLSEMKGRGNDKPAAKYFPYIVRLLEDDIVKGIIGGGYEPEHNFDMNDLPEDERDRLYKEKPTLMPPPTYFEQFGADDHIVSLLDDWFHDQNFTSEPEWDSELGKFVCSGEYYTWGSLNELVDDRGDTNTHRYLEVSEWIEEPDEDFDGYVRYNLEQAAINAGYVELDGEWRSTFKVDLEMVTYCVDGGDPNNLDISELIHIDKETIAKLEKEVEEANTEHQQEQEESERDRGARGKKMSWLLQGKMARPNDNKIQMMVKKYGLSNEQIEQAISTDPSPNQTDFFPWICKNLKEKKITFPEDMEKIKGWLTQFIKLKRSPGFTGEKDIQRYTPADLYQALDENAGTKSNKQEIRDLKAEGVEGAKIVFNRGGVICYEVTDYKALMTLSSNTAWCTTQEEYAKDYTKSGPEYVIYKDGKPYAQYDPDSGMFMDKADRRVAVRNPLDMRPSPNGGRLELVVDRVLIPVIKALPDIFGDVRYEEITESDALKTAEAAVFYAVNVIKAPFPAGEGIITTDERSAWGYYLKFIKPDRWPEGEKLFSSNPYWALRYAQEIKQRFPAGEPAIKTDASYSVAYAQDVLNGPFPEGEAEISTDAVSSWWYASRVLKDRFPMGEEAISGDAEVAWKYTKDMAKLGIKLPDTWPSIDEWRNQIGNLPQYDV